MSTTAFFAELSRRNRLLAVAGWAHVALLVVMIVAAPFDARLVTGINPWIKPIKFAISIAIYLWTVAWLLEYAGVTRRAVRIVSAVIAVAMVTEMVLIAMQATRGVTSHFNNDTPFDAMVFSVMGIMIGVNTIALTAILAWFCLRTTRLAPPIVWGIRLGLVLTIVASAEGGAIVANQGHTVGADEGGPGLPLVNWSTEAGDLRVAHFLGLHAMQVLPLVGYLVSRYGRRFRPGQQVALVIGTAVIYALVFTTLFMAAMAGRPVLALG